MSYSILICMQVLINWFVSGMAVFIAAYLLPGVHVDTFVTALLVAFVLGIANAVVKPILFVLTLPITIMTLGLFALLLNAFMIVLTDWVIDGFQVDGFLWALLFSLLLSLLNSLFYRLRSN